MSQRYWEDIEPGQELEACSFPLTIYRMVLAAASNRDFNAIHHNADYARSTGAPDMYANTLFLQGMWEKCVRNFIGLDGTIRGLAGFRMNRFNIVGSTPVVIGEVARKWLEGQTGLAEIALKTVNDGAVTVGPGSMTVTLPRR
jgi:acyl dehydratase